MSTQLTGPRGVSTENSDCVRASTAADGTPDARTLHAGEPAPPDSGEKWIAQIWLHERPYDPALPPGNSHADATPLVREYAAEHALRLDE